MPKRRSRRGTDRASPYGNIIQARPKNFGIGQAVQHPRDLTRFVKWPKYVRIQRQRRVLNKRLRVPPSINQFTRTLDKNVAADLFAFMGKYRPETKAERKERLRQEAAARAEGNVVEKSKPYVVKYGINHVTGLIEQKKAQLVVIAHDVDPIEIVLWLPSLCRKMGVPYCIVKGKSRLGAVVHKKTATVLCLTRVRNEDKPQFTRLVETITTQFNERYEEIRKQWGGGLVGLKSQAKIDAANRALKREAIARAV